MSDTTPPVSLMQWLIQLKEDPCIPAKFKNGKDQLKLSDTTFRSGSMLNSTEYLHLQVIWHPYIRIESLGDMMKNHPENGWTGFVSADNIRRADFLFNEKRPLWQQYLNEVRLRDIEDESATQTFAQSLLPNGTKMPRNLLRPSLDCGLLCTALYLQKLAMTTTRVSRPGTEELKRAYLIPESGDTPAETEIRLAVNQPISPITPKNPKRKTPDMSIGADQSTPGVDSYQPARGGKYNKPAADEYYVNTALVMFLQNIAMLVGDEFSSLDWVGARLAFKLTESVTTTNPDTGDAHTNRRPIIEARVDGYLCRRGSPFETQLNDVPLAIVEVKPFTFRSALTAIRRQEGAEMASWISQARDSMAGLLQSSTSGKKRRLMLSQHRHEIYIVVGEYGAGFEEHIRPSKSVVSGQGKRDSKASKSSERSIAEDSTQEHNSFGRSKPTPPHRYPGLLQGSPSYIRRVESMSIKVAEDPGPIRQMPQQTQPAPITRDLPRKGKQWVPNAENFLIMHEFGPFITSNPAHMELFIKRIIALMLELRGPQARFVPETVSTQFLCQTGFIQASTTSEASSPTTPLRKARSWTATTRKAHEDWEKPSEKSVWRG